MLTTCVKRDGQAFAGGPHRPTVFLQQMGEVVLNSSGEAAESQLAFEAAADSATTRGRASGAHAESINC